ncbi:AIPR family protein, partial [Enterococcus faecium]|uniref:AIPR family protein n=1 Tax=Enterococcus faecium TaxID=1352 RepID=UPI000A724801
EMVSNIIMFKELDKVTKNGAGSNGYKANINAYTLSYLYWFIEEKMNMKFNYSKIWQQQSVQQPVLEFMGDISYEVRDVLTRVDGNVTEYAKRIGAWDDVKSMVKIDKDYDLSRIITSKADVAQIKKIARNNENLKMIILVPHQYIKELKRILTIIQTYYFLLMNIVKSFCQKNGI